MKDLPDRPPLDRAAHLRTKPNALAELEHSDDAWIIPVWRNKNLLLDGEPPKPVLLPMKLGRALVDEASERVFLGLVGGRGCFAVTVEPGDDAASRPELEGRGEFQDLRLAGNFLPRRDAELLAYARGMLYWHRHHRFCAGCGSASEAAEGGHVRVCPNCERRHFPRTDPAIMALVIHEGRCLLARQPRFPPSMFSVLAGFVEPGESLEDAVVREVGEEVGLEVYDLRYLRSQPWPFPSSLMLGFSMQAKTDRYRLDDEELEDARWVTREQLADPADFFVPPAFSLSRQLIDAFVAGDI